MAVVTAVTQQDEDEFFGLDWQSFEAIRSQLLPILKRYELKTCKIGIVPNFEVLSSIIDLIHEFQPEVKIVWDPVIRSSSGFQLMDGENVSLLRKILGGLTLITPNAEEQQILESILETDLTKTNLVSSLIKGGHTSEEEAIDRLHTEDQTYQFASKRLVGFDKHGTGCVLSSAIVANLASGFDLPKACDRAKQYMTRFLQTSTTKLGLHHRL